MDATTMLLHGDELGLRARPITPLATVDQLRTIQCAYCGLPARGADGCAFGAMCSQRIGVLRSRMGEIRTYGSVGEA